MFRITSLLLTTSLLVSCATSPSPPTPDYANAVDALNVYYRAIPESELPTGPTLIKLDEDKALTRVVFASCNDEELPNPALVSISKEEADLFLFIGDNVYGDRDGRGYANADVELEELRESYTDLAKQEGYKAIAANMPVLAMWDDHDYGMDDFGRDFMGKILAERIFEKFFQLEDEAAGHDGVYYSKMIGPEGQRTQIIMLDTRYFRSDLTPTDDWGKTGKERYIPSEAPDQDMLGAAQWAWLEGELKKPADLRLLVSSIQILPVDHGWEAWSTLPLERDRLLSVIKGTGAEGVVMLSGDRHSSYLYKDEDRGPYPLYEATSSSLNVAFSRTADSPETDRRMIGKGYAFENYGEVEIDWEGRKLDLILNDNAGNEVRSVTVPFDEIKAG